MGAKTAAKAKTSRKPTTSPKKKVPVSRPKQPKTPKKLRITSHPVLGPIVHDQLSQFQRKPTGAPAAGLFVDQYEAALGDQVEIKSDRATFDVEAARCCKADYYSAGTAPTGSVQRLSWLPPIPQITTAGDKAKVDQRGLLVDMHCATITFKNVTDDTLKIRSNTPRTASGVICTRDCNLSCDLAPHSSRTHKIGLGTNTYFSPLTTWLTNSDKLKELATVLADLVIVTPNISLDTGSSYNSNRMMCQITLEVKYAVCPDVISGLTSVHRDPFIVQNLSSLSDMFTVQGLQAPTGTLFTPLATYLKPQIVQPELTGEKWMRLELHHKQGDFSYSYRLVFCDSKGQYHSKVQLREFQGSDYRMALLGNCSTFVRHRSRTDIAGGFTYGGVLAWDDQEEAWMMYSARTTVTADISDPGPETTGGIIPATTPLVVFSVSPPRDVTGVSKGGHKLVMQHPDDTVDLQNAGAIIQTIDAFTRILKVVSTLVSVFL